MIIKKILILASFICLFSCESIFDNELDVPGVTDHEVIWDNGMFNAFTDLIEFDGAYYCCFREGPGHIPNNENDYGQIRILKSINGNKWDLIHTISIADYDLRDPHMSITPNNRLMVNFGCSGFRNNEFQPICTMAVFYTSNNLKEGKMQNVSPIRINLMDYDLKSTWLWKVTWYQGKAYGVVYGDSGPYLLSSTDGINYSVITRLNVLGGETDIAFSDDGMMFLYIRGGITNGYYAESYPPYNDFTFKPSPYFIQSPDILKIKDSFLIAGRGLTGTTILKYKEGEFNWLLTIEDGLEYGYPGMIRVNDQLWMTYYVVYSSAVIYLVKLDLYELGILELNNDNHNNNNDNDNDNV